MKINVKITKVEAGNIKARADITLDDQYAVHGYTIVEGKNGLFINAPQREYTKDGEKKYTDIFHPVTAEAREALNAAIMDAYNAEG